MAKEVSIKSIIFVSNLTALVGIPMVGIKSPFFMLYRPNFKNDNITMGTTELLLIQYAGCTWCINRLHGTRYNSDTFRIALSVIDLL